MKISLKLLFLPILLFSSSLVAQKYIDAFIETIDGNTIEKKILEEDYFSKSEIHFQNTAANPTSLPIDQIKYFIVKGDKYISATIEASTSKKALTKYAKKEVFNTSLQKSFVKELVGGTYSLFLFKNSFSIQHFYIKENNEYVLLKYRKGTNNSVLNEENYFQNQLVNYLEKKCPYVNNALKKSKYEKSSLKSLFKLHDKCEKEFPADSSVTDEFLIYNYYKNVDIKYGILAGVSLANLSFDGKSGNHFFLESGEYDSKIKPNLGASLEIVFRKRYFPLSFRSELMYSSYYKEVFYEIDEFGREYYSRIGGNYLVLNTMLSQHIGHKNSIFFNLGISQQFLLSNTNEYDYFVYDLFIFTREITSGFQNYEISFIGGVGIQLGKFLLSVNYKHFKSPFRFPSNLRIDRISANIGYQF